MPPPMPPPALILAALSLPAILDTVLGRLALLFLTGAGGDLAAARHAASQMLAAYNAESPNELRLAAEIMSFGFHALEALSQAAAPDLPLTKILRLRDSAVSLSREAHKAQRKLDQLQRERRAGIPAQPVENLATQTETAPTRPQIDKALALIEATREAPGKAPLEAMTSAARNGGKTWTQAYQQRLTAKRIADNLKKNQAAHARQTILQNAGRHDASVEGAAFPG
jgi:hypothetical protein